MMETRALLFILISILLSACSTVSTKDPSRWPAEMAERDYYIDVFNADSENQQWQNQDDYLRWVVRFYRGWALYPRGWKWLTKEVSETVEGEQKVQLAQAMASLGERISSEWSKDGRGRTVNTTHLMIWGDALKLAVKEGRQIELASQISVDVDDLIASRISPEVIDLDRYFGPDEEHSDIAHEEGADQFDDPFDV